MVATGQKDTFNNVVMVFCNIDGYVHSTQNCHQQLCIHMSLAQPIQRMCTQYMHRIPQNMHCTIITLADHYLHVSPPLSRPKIAA